MLVSALSQFLHVRYGMSFRGRRLARPAKALGSAADLTEL